MSTITVTFRLPRPYPRKRGRPLPLTGSMSPGCVPGGTGTCASPSSAGTAAVVPSKASGTPDVQVVAQVGARPGEPRIGAGPVITYASPGGPPGAGLGIPRPPSRSAVPSGTPRG